MNIRNFSRHKPNIDQIKAVRSVIVDAEFDAPSSPFFEDIRHLRESINGHISIVVAPGAMLLELWSAQGDDGLSEGTTILIFESDQAARKRARFAAIKLKAFKIEKLSIATYDGHEFCLFVPALTDQIIIEPTVENNFSDGAEFPYGTPKSEPGTVTVYDTTTGHRAVVGLPANLAHLVQDGFVTGFAK